MHNRSPSGCRFYLNYRMQSTGRSSHQGLFFIRHLTAALVAVWTSVGLMAAVIHVEGTHDLDHDGQSELLLLTTQDGLGAVRYVEMDSVGQHQLLWSFSPQEGRSWRITDAKLLDLDRDTVPELVVTVLAVEYNGDNPLPWLYVFPWEGTAFTKTPLTLTGFNGTNDRFRPVNISHYVDPQDQKLVLVVALGSPSRQVVLFKPVLTETGLEVTDPVVLRPDLSKNGYARLFAGVFHYSGEPYLAAFSPEGNLLKTTLYTLQGEVRQVISDVLALQGSRNLIGPAILSHPGELAGRESLLLPFEDGTVLTLAYDDSVLTLTPSSFSKKGLFVLPVGASDSEVNATVLARVEQGLYGPPLEVTEGAVETPVPQPSPEATPVLAAQDSIVLGDTLFYQATPDTAHGFYSFRWLQRPPAGARFQPLTGIIEWVPSREQLGPQQFTFTYAIRLREKLVSELDSLGDRHHLTPVLEQNDVQFTILVVDSAQPILPIVEVPREMYRVVVTVPAKPKEMGRFTFDGEAPFGVQVEEVQLPFPVRQRSYFTHTITANLGGITDDKRALFSYQKSGSVDDRATLTITHDFSARTVHLSVSPTEDSVAQSYNPEDWLAQLYRYPEYFFEGFPQGMLMDTVGRSIRFSFGLEQKPHPRRYSTIQLFSPTKPEHVLVLRLHDIDLQGVRGTVNVKEDSSRVITTVIDFRGSFVPLDLVMDMGLLAAGETRPEVTSASVSPPEAEERDVPMTDGELPTVDATSSPVTPAVATPPVPPAAAAEPPAAMDTNAIPDTIATQEVESSTP